MGTWDIYPWDNDTAADWFGELMDSTGFAERVGEALRRRPVDDHWEAIRAAGYILIHLGRVYIWPVNRLQDDLTVAVRQFEFIVQMLRRDDEPEFVQAVSNELERLRARLNEYRWPDTASQS